ncbi:hypothetical protein [Saccharothrix australiensis]|uniref:Uncharacterized protein n=1 Tax=Saccharothrix australiensis TaxID=2072 RepID=A0A495VSR5_9PSEU|nr:hypothetical protein [Saccharothrix australiensis]RKT52416.1 hypothetical protein C8E97_0926 [Saccharothrix australiensis]
MTDNVSAGVVLLPAETTVPVTRDEDHQAELSRYPVAPGMPRTEVVELAWTAGGRVIEVRLDGLRVGELTHAVSQRYAPVLARLSAGGARAGCVALLRAGVQGTEVSLRLPRDGDAPIPSGATGFAVSSWRGSGRRRPWWIAVAVVAAIALAAAVGSGVRSTETVSGSPSARDGVACR